MSIEVVEKFNAPGIWSVEQIDDTDGACYVTVFYGPNSRDRAEAYAATMRR